MPINVPHPARINSMPTVIFCLTYDTPFDYTELPNMQLPSVPNPCALENILSVDIIHKSSQERSVF